MERDWPFNRTTDPSPENWESKEGASALRQGDGNRAMKDLTKTETDEDD